MRRLFEPPIDRHQLSDQPDLDVFHLAFEGWEAAFQQSPHPQEVLVKVYALYQKLLAKQELIRDEAVAHVVLKGGMLLGALQEAVLPWGKDRPQLTTQTYSTLEQIIFTKIDPERFPEAYARLMLRRAVLMREYMDDHQDVDEELTEICAQDLRDERVLRIVEMLGDPRAKVAYLCQRVHTLSVRKHYQYEQFLRWQRELEEIEREIDGIRVDSIVHDELMAVVDYTRGVGHKRFMWQLRNDHDRMNQREAHAREARHWLNSLQYARGGKSSALNINFYHTVISTEQSLLELEAAELDAVVWLNPEEALIRSEILKQNAAAHYPSVVSKLDRTIAIARRKIGK